MEFSRQEYWNWVSFSIPGIFLTHESNPHHLHLLHWQADSLPLVLPGVDSKGTYLCIYMYQLSPKIPLPSGLLHNAEQNSLCYTVHHWWLSILKEQCLHVHPKLPKLSLAPTSFPSLQKPYFCFVSFICIMFSYILHTIDIIWCFCSSFFFFLHSSPL